MASWSERELEDWLCEHPEFFGSTYEHIARQVVLPGGKKVDMLGWDQVFKCPIVVELKSIEADGTALSQVLSYMRIIDLSRRALTDEFFQNLQPSVTENKRLVDLLQMMEGLARARGVIVAPAFSHRLIIASDWFGDHMTLQWAQMQWEPAYIRSGFVEEQAAGGRSSELVECHERIIEMLESMSKRCICTERYWCGDAWTYISGDGGFLQEPGETCNICDGRIPPPTPEEIAECEENMLGGDCDGENAMGEDHDGHEHKPKHSGLEE